MNRMKYANAKHIALATAIMLTASPLAGITEVSYASTQSSLAKTEYQKSANLADVTFDDLHVIGAKGEQLRYYAYVEQGGKITPNTKFFVVDPKTYKTIPWTPSVDDWAVLLGTVDKDGKDLTQTGSAPIYVKDDNGNMMLWWMWWHTMSSNNNYSSAPVYGGTYYTRTANGTYADYKPSLSEKKGLSTGNFSGKAVATPAVKLNAEGIARVQNSGTKFGTSSLSKSTGTATMSKAAITKASTVKTTTPSTTVKTTTTTKPSTTSTSTSTRSSFGGSRGSVGG